ncbi:MAG: hypothetical protein KTV77_04840 [Wolbachia endosymbiont of Fragariocoptes setiger]|nr:hypothetical protein [Wolbachia endosymbiont of Fragariocoptes setiger]
MGNEVNILLKDINIVENSVILISRVLLMYITIYTRIVNKKITHIAIDLDSLLIVGLV